MPFMKSAIMSLFLLEVKTGQIAELRRRLSKDEFRFATLKLIMIFMLKLAKYTAMSFAINHTAHLIWTKGSLSNHGKEKTADLLLGAMAEAKNYRVLFGTEHEQNGQLVVKFPCGTKDIGERVVLN